MRRTRKAPWIKRERAKNKQVRNWCICFKKKTLVEALRESVERLVKVISECVKRIVEVLPEVIKRIMEVLPTLMSVTTEKR